MSAKPSKAIKTLIADLVSIGWSRASEFPKELCTTPSSESGVMDSNVEYLCFVLDKRFENEVRVVKAYPYTWKNVTGDPIEVDDDEYFGWNTGSGSPYVDNAVRPIHGEIEDEFVILFKKL